MKYILFFITIFFAMNTSAQVDWKWQARKFVDEGTTPPFNYHYNWLQENDIRQGVRINLKASEDIKIYLEADNARMKFNWSPSDETETDYIKFLSVKIGAATYTIYDGNPTSSVTWDCSSYFNSPGYQYIEVNFIKGSNPLTKTRQYHIYIVPKSDELHRDQYDNSLRVWKSNHPNAKPFIMSVGLDFYNIIPEQFQRHDISSLFDCLLNDSNNPHDIYILYYRYNPQSLKNNAAVFASAVNYVSSTAYDSKKIAVGGRSMGGIISRYALAKAEEDGTPLPVTTWTALDSPHHGAHIAPNVMNYMKVIGNNYIDKSADNEAAKTMLNYNPFDMSGDIHNAFYSDLNALNDDGFPHITHNIGTAFSNNIANTNSGHWLTINVLTAPKLFYMKPDDKLAGSYLPKIDVDPILFGVVSKIKQKKNPTFMSYKSALDIEDNNNDPNDDLANSRFDVHVTPNVTSWHNIFPAEIATNLAKEIIAPEVYRFQDVTIDGKGEFRAYDEIYAGESVRTDRIEGDVIIDAVDITFKADSTVVLEDGFVVTGGTIFTAKIEKTHKPNCLPYQTLVTKDDNEHELRVSRFNDNIDDETIESVTDNSIKIYPNPAMDRTTIDYSVAKEGQVNITLIDSQGRTIRNLINEVKMEGEHQLELNTSDLAKGMYLIQLTIEGEQLYEKMIKL